MHLCKHHSSLQNFWASKVQWKKVCDPKNARQAACCVWDTTINLIIYLLSFFVLQKALSMALKSGEERLKEMEAEMAL